jgi:DNA topoisomerase-1
MASQMAESKQLSVSISVSAKDALFQATGTRILFPGFLRAYVEGQDDTEAALEEREIILPDLKVGDSCNLDELKVTEHETKPPARYTEATLIQTLEKEGVGRPSTYASIISTIIDRGYVKRAGNALVPTFTAFAVTKLLRKHFPELVDLQFTASMEEELDEIAEGKRKHLDFLREFFLDEKKGLRPHIQQREKQIDPEEARSISLESFPDVNFRIGRFGPYFEKKEPGQEVGVRASIPEGVAPSDLQAEDIEKLIQLRKDGPPSLGVDPQTGLKVYVMTGRYGPYLQLGENEELQTPAPAPAEKRTIVDGDTGEVIESAPGKKTKGKKKAKAEAKPKSTVKRVVIPKGFTPDTITLPQALGLLALPRTLGQDEQGRRIQAGLGRFGPFVVKSGGDLPGPEYRSLKKEDDILTVDLARALALFAEPKMGRGRRAKAQALKTFGNHPREKKAIELFDGPYGPYVKCGKVNASVPKDIKPDELSLEKAIELIDARMS